MVLVFTIELSVFHHMFNLIVTIVLLYRGINSVISITSYQSAMETIGSIEKVSDEINRLSKEERGYFGRY